MDAQDFRSLQEAYLEVVMNEGKKPYPVQRVRNQIERIRQRGGDNWKLRQSYEDELRRQAKEHEIKKAEKRSPTFYQQKNKLKMTKTQREQVDLYDIILSHLLDESFADRIDKQVKKNKEYAKKRKPVKAPSFADRIDKQVEQRKKEKDRIKEQVDLYDIILSHLLDEGYAETPEAAEVIMVNMSEDWRGSIVEEVLNEGKGSKPDTTKDAEEFAYKIGQRARKNPQNADKYQQGLVRLKGFSPSGSRVLDYGKRGYFNKKK